MSGQQEDRDFAQPAGFEDKTEVRVMDPEAFANMPRDFAEYVERNRAILPNYGPFARETIARLAELEPRQRLLLHGPHGIGKSTVLASALLEAGVEQGYEPLGSICISEDAAKPLVFVDSHESLAKGGQGTTLGPGGGVLLHTAERQIRTLQTIRERVAQSSGRAVLIADEIIHNSAAGIPALAQYIFEEAEARGVTVIFTEPDLLYVPAHIQRESLKRQFSEENNVELVEVTIPEQPVNLTQIPHMAEAFGVDPGLAELFDRNPQMARLRVVTFIAQALARRKMNRDWRDDETIWTAEEAQYLVLQHIFSAANEHDRKVFGLTRPEADALEAILQPPVSGGF